MLVEVLNGEHQGKRGFALPTDNAHIMLVVLQRPRNGKKEQRIKEPVENLKQI